MFYIMNWRCLLFFMVHLLIHNVLVQSIETREAIVGDTVILPCSTVAGGDVFWQDDEETVVINIIKNEENFLNQDPKYKGRVQTFQTEIAKGNFSIKLSNVKLSDSGTYTCHPTAQRVELTVKGLMTQSPTLQGQYTKKQPTLGNGDITIRASSLFLLGFSLLYSLDF